jgi:hypothetical protein
VPYQASKQTTTGRDLRQTAPVVGPDAVTIMRGKFVAWVERSETQGTTSTLRKRSRVSLRSTQATKKKGKRNAERRVP